MLLPREGHLDILPDRGTSKTTCGKVSQLEVCQLLCSDSQVVYPVGLNSHENSLIITLPESLTNGANLPGGKSIYLKVDILQSIMEGPEWKASPPGDCLSTLTASSFKATLPKVERAVSMTMEVRELLFRAVLDMSRHASGELNPKKTKSLLLYSHLQPHQTGRSLQASGHIIPGGHPG